MDFIVLDIDDDRWDSYVRRAHMYDFHHTSLYHKIEIRYEYIPKMFVAFDKDQFVCIPLMIRPILGTDLFDATSVYGYSGPISSNPQQEMDQKLIDFFKVKLTEYCIASRIVSVFSRLHPCFEQGLMIEGLGKILCLSRTVGIDLTIPRDEQFSRIKRQYRQQISKLNKQGFRVEVEGVRSLALFKDIYLETMDRVGAHRRFYYSDDYLISFFNNECFDTKILCAYNPSSEPVAAAMFTFTGSIVQYHLCGTKTSALAQAPMKGIVNEARGLGTEMGMKVLHLGGGLDGTDGDKLFRFKSGFSKNFYDFRVWNWVVDQQRYDDLVASKNGTTNEGKGQFFPLYRKAG